MKKLSVALVLATAAIGLSAPGIAVAHKGKSHGHHAVHVKKSKGHRTVEGTVSAVAADSITLSHKNGFSRTIPVTADTKVYVNGHAGALADIHVGFKAVVKVNKDGNAQWVAAKDPAYRKVNKGPVSGVGADSITVHLKKFGDVTIAVTDKTKIVRNGHTAALADIQVGDNAIVVRAKDGNARWIHAKDPLYRKVNKGTVAAVGADSITIHAKFGDPTIAVTDKTRIIRNGSVATLADIQVGDNAEVIRGKDGTARSIHAKDAAHTRVVVRGTVDSVGSDSLTVKTKDGSTTTCHVISSTRIQVGHKHKATLADIQVGYRVLVYGFADGTALRIVAHAPKK